MKKLNLLLAVLILTCLGSSGADAQTTDSITLIPGNIGYVAGWWEEDEWGREEWNLYPHNHTNGVWGRSDPIDVVDYSYNHRAVVSVSIPADTIPTNATVTKVELYYDHVNCSGTNPGAPWVMETEFYVQDGYFAEIETDAEAEQCWDMDGIFEPYYAQPVALTYVWSSGMQDQWIDLGSYPVNQMNQHAGYREALTITLRDDSFSFGAAYAAWQAVIGQHMRVRITWTGDERGGGIGASLAVGAEGTVETTTISSLKSQY